MPIGSLSQKEAIHLSRLWVAEQVREGQPVRSVVEATIATLTNHLSSPLSSDHLAVWKETLVQYAVQYMPRSAPASATSPVTASTQVNVPVHLNISLSISVVPTVTVSSSPSSVSPVIVDASSSPSSSIPSPTARSLAPVGSSVNAAPGLSDADFASLLGGALGVNVNATR